MSSFPWKKNGNVSMVMIIVGGDGLPRFSAGEGKGEGGGGRAATGGVVEKKAGKTLVAPVATRR